jgi:tetratricopeptide (TPR) repeat protein
MKTIFADFNALTESEHVRLGSRASQDDIRRSGVRPGDWTWLSDGELQVGARLAEDPVYGLVGVPAWETMVHLQDEEGRDFGALFTELRSLSERSRNSADESHLLQLIARLEATVPDNVRGRIEPGYFDFRRANALLELGRTELAFQAAEEALRAQPARDSYVFFYLEMLRRLDLDRALEEASRRADDPRSSATVIGACINILATHADRLAIPERSSACLGVLEWGSRFEQAPSRERVRASILSQVDVNVGLALLQLGRVSEAQLRFQEAHAADPRNPAMTEILALDTYDERARSIASRIRERALAA